jgi:very-short-patch-repair endonuclease
MNYPLNDQIDVVVDAHEILKEILLEYKVSYEYKKRLDQGVANFYIPSTTIPLVVQVDGWEPENNVNYKKLLNLKQDGKIALLRFHNNFIQFRPDRIAQLIIWEFQSLSS